MKNSPSLVIPWIILVLIAAVAGDQMISSRWRASAERELSALSALAAQAISATDWTEPPESDPRWQQLEDRLNVAIVLSETPSDSSVRPQVDGTLGDGLRATEAYEVTWMGSPARISQEMSGQRIGGRQASDNLASIRVTMQPQSSKLRWFWWLLCIAQVILGAALLSVLMRNESRQLRAQRIVLEPWLRAIRANRPQKFNLPMIEQLDSSLEPPLTVVSEYVNRTINDLRSANNRSELVLGNLQEGVLAVDDRSQVLLANNSLRKMLDVQDESYLYRPLLEVIRFPAIAKLVDHVLLTQSPREETAEMGSTGRSLRLLARPLNIDKNRFGALVTVRDETLLKRIESVRRDFVANASHELKTPLAAIRAYAETLQLGALDDRESAERFVGNIIAQADRINNLVQGMLQLSRVQSGSALRIEQFDAKEAIAPCIAAAEAMAQNKNVILQAWLPETDVDIRSDRDGFQTIVSNLLSNAVRYTPSGGLVTAKLQVEPEWCLISVSDTGIGIRPEDLERIFERFYRAEKDRSSDTGGTGLGLSIVKHLVQALGGSVSARSQPGEGSTFEVRLPR